MCLLQNLWQIISNHGLIIDHYVATKKSHPFIGVIILQEKHHVICKRYAAHTILRIQYTGRIQICQQLIKNSLASLYGSKPFREVPESCAVSRKIMLRSPSSTTSIRLEFPRSASRFSSVDGRRRFKETALFLSSRTVFSCICHKRKLFSPSC